MRLSARNQLTGTIASIHVGSVMTVVKVDIGAGQRITSSITRESVEELGLQVGSPVTVVIKSTEVMLGVD
jgi:molybdate transport system regulatory protein